MLTLPVAVLPALATIQASQPAHIDLPSLASVHEEMALHSARARQRFDLSQRPEWPDALGWHPMVNSAVNPPTLLLL